MELREKGPPIRGLSLGKETRAFVPSGLCSATLECPLTLIFPAPWSTSALNLVGSVLSAKLQCGASIDGARPGKQGGARAIPDLRMRIGRTRQPEEEQKGRSKEKRPRYRRGGGIADMSTLFFLYPCPALSCLCRYSRPPAKPASR